MCRVSLVVASRGRSLLRGLLAAGASRCRVQAPGRGLGSCGALQHVGSSQTRGGTGVPCIVSWTPNYWTTGEAPERPL